MQRVEIYLYWLLCESHKFLSRDVINVIGTIICEFIMDVFCGSSLMLLPKYQKSNGLVNYFGFNNIQYINQTHDAILDSGEILISHHSDHFDEINLLIKNRNIAPVLDIIYLRYGKFIILSKHNTIHFIHKKHSSFVLDEINIIFDVIKMGTGIDLYFLDTKGVLYYVDKYCFNPSDIRCIRERRHGITTFSCSEEFIAYIDISGDTYITDSHGSKRFICAITNVESISCGNDCILFLTKNKELWMLNSSIASAKKVLTNVLNFVCRYDYCCAQRDDMNLYVWGLEKKRTDPQPEKHLQWCTLRL